MELYKSLSLLHFSDLLCSMIIYDILIHTGFNTTFAYGFREQDEIFVCFITIEIVDDDQGY